MLKKKIIRSFSCLIFSFLIFFSVISVESISFEPNNRLENIKETIISDNHVIRSFISFTDYVNSDEYQRVHVDNYTDYISKYNYLIQDNYPDDYYNRSYSYNNHNYNLLIEPNIDRYKELPDSLVDEKREPSHRPTFANGKTLYVGGTGPNNYTKIQDAINDSVDGDTVYVYSGTYQENVIVNKSIILKGENKNNTCIENNRDNIITILSQYVSIENFLITINSSNSSSGIYITNNSCRVKNNIIYSKNPYAYGLNVISDNNLILSNDIFNCYSSVYISNSKENIIESNNIGSMVSESYLNLSTGWISLYRSTDITVVNNDFDSGGIFISGGEFFHYNIMNWNTHTIIGNHINNKPIYYLKNSSSEQVIPSDAGQVIIANCSNKTVNNINVTSPIQIGYSTRCQINNNHISHCSYGIMLHKTNNMTINENILYENYGGIIGYTSYTEIKNNEISGITAQDSLDIGVGGSNNTITYNKISNSSSGIGCSGNNNIISFNNVFNQSTIGIFLGDGDSNEIKSNLIYNNEKDGIHIGDSLNQPINTRINDNYIFNNWAGINLYEPWHSGINLYHQYIINNAINENKYGIYLDGAKYINISKNTINENKYGIYLDGAKYINISKNRIYSNWNGICLSSSSFIDIMNNVFNYDGIIIQGDYWSGNNIDFWNTHKIENNIANGRPIRYYKNNNDIIIPNDTSQVILANCSNFMIQNLILSNVDTGIQLGYCSGNTIKNNTIINNNYYGINLDSSYVNIITSNNVSNNNGIGIIISRSFENNISGNNIQNNLGNGIEIKSGFEIIIKSNNVKYNGLSGISIKDSSEKNYILNNKCTDNYVDGIGLFQDSNDNKIIGNNCSNNLKGIAIRESDSNIVKDNFCYINYNGILLNNANYNIITNNHCYENSIGIHLTNNSNFNNISNSFFEYCGYEGLAMIDSNHNTIYRNHFGPLNWVGLLLDNSANNTISYNIVTGNNWIGIGLFNTENNKLSQNIIKGNTDYGIIGALCNDDATFNYWGDARPDFYFDMPFNHGDIVIPFIPLITRIKIFPWALKEPL